MATWTIKGHNRTSKLGISHSVRSYQQNRKDGLPNGGYVKKGYTACQTDIAAVIKRDLAFNATVENLRSSHAWRNYVCNCKTSKVYDIATTGVAGPDSIYRDNPVRGADFTYTNKNGKKVTVKGKIATYGWITANSSCGVQVMIPPHRAPLTGKQIVLLKAGA